MNENTPLNIRRYRKYYRSLEPTLKNRKVQAYLMVVLSLFTISFFGIFAIRPTLKTIATLQRQIEDRSLLSEKLETKINALILAQEEYRRIETALPSIYSLLPEQAEFPLLLRKLENLAADNGATIAGIQFDPIVVYELSQSTNKNDSETAVLLQTDNQFELTPIFFTLILRGSYQNLVAFLDQLTKVDRLVTIESVNLTIGQTQSNDATLNLGVSSRSYYFSTTQ